MGSSRTRDQTRVPCIGRQFLNHCTTREVREGFLKATFGVRAAGWITFFWLAGGEVTGWRLGNLNHQPSGSNQSGVCVLVVSVWSPSSTREGLGSWKTCVQLYCIYWYLQEELGLCFITELLFLDCFSFVSAFPHFLISNCLSLLFGTQGRPRRQKPFSTNNLQVPAPLIIPAAWVSQGTCHAFWDARVLTGWLKSTCKVYMYLLRTMTSQCDSVMYLYWVKHYKGWV